MLGSCLVHAWFMLGSCLVHFRTCTFAHAGVFWFMLGSCLVHAYASIQWAQVARSAGTSLPVSGAIAMAWASWAPGQLPLDASGFPVAPWAHLVPEFPILRRPLRVALPCIGLDGIGAGLKEVRWDGLDVVHAFDVDSELVPALQALHGRQAVEGWNIGLDGNILLADEKQWQDVDLIISGPPCPPWSSIGQRRSEADARAKVFRKVILAIKEQAGRGVLLGFIIEMVPGMAHARRFSGLGEQSYYEQWMKEMKTDLPNFYICDWVMQSADYLPQHRERLYTVGVRRDVLGPGILTPPRLPGRAQLLRVSLADILHQGLPVNCEEHIHGQQRANLMTVKQRILAYRPRGEEQCYCLPIDRDPSMTYGNSARRDGNTCTLRTQNEMLWLLMVNAAGSVVLSRCLHPVERLSLQGFRPELAKFLGKSALLRFTGNACTAPVITTVLRQLVLAFAHPAILGASTIPMNLWQPSEEIFRYLTKVKHLNLHRASIAILDRLLFLEAMGLV